MSRFENPEVRTAMSRCDRAAVRGAKNRRDRPYARTVAAAVIATALLMLAACSHLPRPHLQWPWHRTPAQGPQEVHELVMTSEDGSTPAFPQYWKRNTLLVDLQSASGTGSIVLKPREHTYWPVRIAFRVMPGRIGALEVRANQRVVLPVIATGTKPIDLELAPDVFVMKTPQIAVSWGPAAQPPGS